MLREVRVTVSAADVVTLARTHLQKFAAHQGSRPDDSRGAPWPLAIETATLLGLAARELAELRAQVRRLEAGNAALLGAIEARRAQRASCK
jgi:hypothetical protein